MMDGVIELKVRLHCKACEKALRKALCKIKGVTCVEIDAISHKIRVMGYVERKVILKAVWKTGTRAAELSQPNQSHHHHKKSTLNGFACIIPKWVLS
ncbi:heavy metal-associated isoprenylated plant protein 30-like [Actinidia eriantha]|uniref:heavy metal-associated isoprenylated plant protein 30-like n=1 Tax=Actinidia eriantha TaxID=165200 RepID=UPI00258CDEAA|nr:heavy metal-associated isoprenylated plant protein 30-like [Actinidia eriantha]